MKISPSRFLSPQASSAKQPAKPASRLGPVCDRRFRPFRPSKLTAADQPRASPPEPLYERGIQLGDLAFRFAPERELAFYYQVLFRHKNVWLRPAQPVRIFKPEPKTRDHPSIRVFPLERFRYDALISNPRSLQPPARRNRKRACFASFHPAQSNNFSIGTSHAKEPCLRSNL